MRKIILDLAVSLDGFIEGPQGETDWCILEDDMNFEGFLDSIDTIFYGRVSYEMWGNFQPESEASYAEKALWKAVHSKKKYVFSSRSQPDAAVTFIRKEELATQVNAIRQQEGKDIWLYGGAQLIHFFIQANLIDIYRISIHPTVLGAGKPLFENLKNRIQLQLAEVNRFRSGVVQLIYTPTK